MQWREINANTKERLEVRERMNKGSSEFQEGKENDVEWYLKNFEIFIMLSNFQAG